MDYDDTIDSLKSIIKSMFIAELVYDGKSSKTSFSPIEVFERWYKNTYEQSLISNDLISSLCLRACQAGYICYPLGKECKYTGLKSSLKDEEIIKVIYNPIKCSRNLEESIKSFVSKHV